MLLPDKPQPLGCNKLGEQSEEHNWTNVEGQVFTLARPTLDLHRTQANLPSFPGNCYSTFWEHKYLVQRQSSSQTICLTGQPNKSFIINCFSTFVVAKKTPQTRWWNHSSLHTPLLSRVTQVYLSGGTQSLYSLTADKQKANLPVWCCLLGGAVWTWPAGVAGGPLQARGKGECMEIVGNHMRVRGCPARANIHQETWHVTGSVGTSTYSGMTKLQLLVSCFLLHVLTCFHLTMLFSPAKACYPFNRKKQCFSTVFCWKTRQTR